MDIKSTLREQGIETHRFEYDDLTTFVVDFGVQSDATVDTVGDTAIVVVDGQQYDIDIDEGSQVFMNNGVLTIEVRE